MDFSLTTIGCAFPVCFTKAGKRKLALHAPAKPQAPPTPQERMANKKDLSQGEDSVLTASNAESLLSSSWKNDHDDIKEDTQVVRNHHRDSLLVYLEQAASVLSFQKGKQLEEDDDDTATTVSFCSASSSGEKLRVSFLEPLVTEVHYRPRTTRVEKYFLHYNEHDYVDFKREYMTGRARNRKVSFKCEDATVHQLPPPAASKQDLFYSEGDLRGFLDDFVQSLNHRL